MTFLAGQILLASQLAALENALPVVKRKTADEQVVSSTAYQNDDHFFWTIEANTAYVLDMCIFTDGPNATVANTATGEVGVQWTKPSLCRMDFGIISPSWQTLSGLLGPANWQAIINDTATTSGQVLLGTSVGAQQSLLRGTVRVGATGGTLQMQWAQWTSNATACKILSGSWGMLTRVA